MNDNITLSFRKIDVEVLYQAMLEQEYLLRSALINLEEDTNENHPLYLQLQTAKAITLILADGLLNSGKEKVSNG